MASPGIAGSGPRARFCHPGTGPGGTVWGLRHRRQRGLGGGGDEPRYGGIRGWDHPPLVARDWPRPLSRHEIFNHHRRWWRKQRLAGSIVETRVSAALERTRDRYRGTPSAAWHQQVEQNRCVTNTSSKKGDVELYERWG